MNTAKKLDPIINSIPNYSELTVYLIDGDKSGHTGRKATYEQVIDRLEEYGATRPPRAINQTTYGGKLVAEGKDEDGYKFWVSVEKPDPRIPSAW